MASVEVGAVSFPTKGSAVEFFKAMQRYAPGETVGDEDAAILRALIEHHPERNQKVGRGIAQLLRGHGGPLWNEMFLPEAGGRQ